MRSTQIVEAQPDSIRRTSGFSGWSAPPADGSVSTSSNTTVELLLVVHCKSGRGGHLLPFHGCFGEENLFTLCMCPFT